MRVVHISPALFGGAGVFGGGERYAVELARETAKHVATRLLAFGPRPLQLRADGLEIQVLPNRLRGARYRANPFNPDVARLLARSDVIHCHQTHTLSTSFALLCAKALGRPVFTTELGGGGLSVYRFVNADSWFEGHLHVSEYSRQIAGHGALPGARVISGGVDTAKFVPDPSVRRRGEVLFVGRLLPHKGINYLIDALDARTPLRLVGRRMVPDRGYYQLLRRLAVGKQVSFHENCDDAAVVRAYQRAACVVLPSVYADVFGGRSAIPELLGQTLLEGMACGTPAVCTAVGGMPEVVEDGVTGFVVPPNDPDQLGEKVRWLCTHPAAVRRMGEAARERVVQRFTWERVVERCLTAYGARPFSSSSGTYYHDNGNRQAESGRSGPGARAAESSGADAVGTPAALAR
jgi:glycosyltransferase involved in cell wall biosynthesis